MTVVGKAYSGAMTSPNDPAHIPGQVQNIRGLLVLLDSAIRNENFSVVQRKLLFNWKGDCQKLLQKLDPQFMDDSMNPWKSDSRLNASAKAQAANGLKQKRRQGFDARTRTPNPPRPNSLTSPPPAGPLSAPRPKSSSVDRLPLTSYSNATQGYSPGMDPWGSSPQRAPGSRPGLAPNE